MEFGKQLGFFVLSAPKQENQNSIISDEFAITQPELLIQCTFSDWNKSFFLLRLVIFTGNFVISRKYLRHLDFPPVHSFRPISPEHHCSILPQACRGILGSQLVPVSVGSSLRMSYRGDQRLHLLHGLHGGRSVMRLVFKFIGQLNPRMATFHRLKNCGGSAAAHSSMCMSSHVRNLVQHLKSAGGR